MRYDYLRYGYQPKESSFEVTAILKDEDERVEFPSKIVKNAILSSHKYNHDGYVIEKELGFNPVTDQETTFKYVEHEHKLEARRIALNNQKQYKKSWKLWFAERLNILRGLEKEFKIIMNHLFGHAINSHQEVERAEVLHIDFDKEEAAHKTRIEQPQVSVQYTIHPHVDELINARQHSNIGHSR